MNDCVRNSKDDDRNEKIIAHMAKSVDRGLGELPPESAKFLVEWVEKEGYESEEERLDNLLYLVSGQLELEQELVAFDDEDDDTWIHTKYLIKPIVLSTFFSKQEVVEMLIWAIDNYREECSDLYDDAEVMRLVIKHEPTMIDLASDKLKNDAAFLSSIEQL